MSQHALLADLSNILVKAGIPFMVTGSHGSSHYSQPRSTTDIDIVIDPTPAQLDLLLASLAGRFYVNADGARAALASRSMFNVIDFASGWKVDFIIRKHRPFSVEEFRRREMVDLEGCRVPMVSPEDVILSKLEWDKITPSERQLHDALHVAVAKWPTLDQQYLRKWAAVLGVLEKLEMLLEKAEEAQPPI
jgi:hypothetical protein